MNKKLEDFFGMEPTATQTVDEQVHPGIPIHKDSNQTIELQPIDLDTFDREMDDIASLALKTFEEIMTRSEMVEDKDCGRLFSAASDMMKNALTANNQKMKVRLDCYDLYSRHMTRKTESVTNSLDNQNVPGEVGRMSRSDILKTRKLIDQTNQSE